VWDQHTRYVEAQGEIRNPRAMFKLDLLSLLRRWKAAGDEVLLLGNFNENVYTGPLMVSLSSNDLCLIMMCFRTTGAVLPPTHMRGWVPINAVFGTSGLVSTSVALLPIQEGVGDHRVFLLDIALETILAAFFSRVTPIASRLLNCASDKIRSTMPCYLINLQIGT
jgi:hypothetical protein